MANGGTVVSVTNGDLFYRLRVVPYFDNYNFIEPSAGNGSFFTIIPTINKIGIDISPEHKDIIKQDFFTYNPPNNIGTPMNNT